MTPDTAVLFSSVEHFCVFQLFYLFIYLFVLQPNFTVLVQPHPSHQQPRFQQQQAAVNQLSVGQNLLVDTTTADSTVTD